jgi:hypothetical protein
MNTWGYRIVQAIACAIATLLITDPVLAVALAADDPLFAPRGLRPCQRLA